MRQLLAVLACRLNGSSDARMQNHQGRIKDKKPSTDRPDPGFWAGSTVVVSLSLTLLLIGCGPSDKAGPWFAKVLDFSGAVQVSVKPKAAARPAKKGDQLYLGGSLTTGPSATAHLLLRNGSKIKVEPGSVLRLKSAREKKSSLILELDQGKVEGTSAGEVEGQGLVLTVSGRTVTFGKGAKFTLSERGLKMEYGGADLVYNGVKKAIVVGEELVFAPKQPPDAGPSADVGPPDAASTPDSEVVGKELVFYLKATGRGRVQVKEPGARRFSRVRRGRTVEIKPGTLLKLARRARAMVSGKKGEKGQLVTGPAELLVRTAVTSGTADEPRFVLEPAGKKRGYVVNMTGRPGTRATPIQAGGVSIRPRVVYRRVHLRVRSEKGRSLLTVHNGAAELRGKGGKKRQIEAGQTATLRAGQIVGPKMPAAADLKISKSGGLRLFTASRTIPLTFKWNRSWKRTLVEVSRSPSFRRPSFADVVTRHSLNLPAVRRGRLYWRVRPVDSQGKPLGAGEKGRVVMLVDTSYRVLKRWPPKNTIEPRFGNTTVYYQNALPRFTFRWRAVSGASEYRLKVYRDTNLAKAYLIKRVRRGTSLVMRPGKLREGRYNWFVAAYAPGGRLLKTSKYRRLSLRYDNATPNLQIVYPRNRLRVSSGSIEVRGTTFRGSAVYVNGQRAELDETYRFKHSVKLHTGVNTIRFRVDDKRRGSSLYTRQVTRR